MENMVRIEDSKFKQNYLVNKPEGEIEGIVILFGGGMNHLNLHKDRDDWNETNFLVRTRGMYEKHNLLTIVVDARLTPEGHYPEYKNKFEPDFDINYIIDMTKHRYGNLPLWFIGTSRGSAYALDNLFKRQDVNGLVLLSSLVVSDQGTPSALDFPIETIKVPTLIGIHASDTCIVTPLSGNGKLYSRLKCVDKEFKIFKGGYCDVTTVKACSNQSYHGFKGMEEEVVDYVSNFIKKNS